MPTKLLMPRHESKGEPTIEEVQAELSETPYKVIAITKGITRPDGSILYAVEVEEKAKSMEIKR